MLEEKLRKIIEEEKTKLPYVEYEARELIREKKREIDKGAYHLTKKKPTNK
jgi:hypothetical protein